MSVLVRLIPACKACACQLHACRPLSDTAISPECAPPDVDASLGAPVLHCKIELIYIAILCFPPQILRRMGAHPVNV